MPTISEGNYMDAHQLLVDEISVLRKSVNSATYGGYREEINAELAAEIAGASGVISKKASRIRQLIAERGSVTAVRRHRTIVAAISAVGLTIISAASVVATVRSVWPDNWPAQRTPQIIAFILVPSALVSWAVLAAIIWQFRKMMGSLQKGLESSLIEYGQRVSVVASEIYTRSVNRVLGPLGILEFPRTAPRLVELDASSVVPLRSLEYVKSFIREHESSAVGIAGPRGIGKTTLMGALANDEDLATTAVLSSPVRYETNDFIRRLTLEITESIIRSATGPDVPRIDPRLHSPRSRLWMTIIALYVGALLIVIEYTSQAFALPSLSIFGTLGAVLLGWALLSLLAGVLLSHSRQRMQRLDPAVAAAIEMQKNVMFEIEHDRSGKVSSRLLGGLLSFEQSDSVKMRRRQTTAADLKYGLQDLFRRFAGRPDRRLLIVIDELDKISKSSDLIEIINDLKDLFHVRGVHFVVSVSDEALTTFEKRGLGSRDAFDSSFDTILGIRPLVAAESLEIIASRVSGFPPLLGLFCHAWSGGLPRDLLRYARSCVEVYRESLDPLPLTAIMQKVVTEDLSSTINAIIRSGPESKELEELANLLSALVAMVEDIRVDLPITDSSDKATLIVGRTTRLGQAVVKHLQDQIQRGDWQEPTRWTFEAMEAVAHAMARRSDALRLWQDAYRTALNKLGAA